MKNIFFLSIISFFLFLGGGAQAQSPQNSLENYTVKVDGLGCPFCAYGLEKKFKELKGVKNSAIDMETGIFTFSYPVDKRLTIEEVNAQVEKAGYTPIYVVINLSDGEVISSKTE